MQIHVFACFLVFGFMEVRDQIRKCYIITVVIFFGAFCHKNGVPKNGFPILFSKSDLGGGDRFFAEFFSEKAKHPRICPSFSGNVGKT